MKSFFWRCNRTGILSGWFFAGLAAGPYLGWALGTLAGGLAGALLPTALASALGIALYAMFVAIVVPQAKKSRAVCVAALLAVALACLFRYLPGLNLIPSGWALIFSAVGASAFCAWRFPLGREEEERGEGAV